VNVAPHSSQPGLHDTKPCSPDTRSRSQRGKWGSGIHIDTVSLGEGEKQCLSFDNLRLPKYKSKGTSQGKCFFFLFKSNCHINSSKMLSRIPRSTLRALAPRPFTNFACSVRRLSSFPKAVCVSPEERQSNTLSWKNLELVTRALHHDGLVILEDVIPHDKLDFLNEKMVEDALFLQSAGDTMPFNYNKGYYYTCPSWNMYLHQEGTFSKIHRG